MVSAIRHGYSAYGNGKCRCQICREAFNAYIRARRQRYAEFGLPAHVAHGTVNAYSNYRCRCPACRVANTDYHRQYRARRAAS